MASIAAPHPGRNALPGEAGSRNHTPADGAGSFSRRTVGIDGLRRGAVRDRRVLEPARGSAARSHVRGGLVRDAATSPARFTAGPRAVATGSAGCPSAHSDCVSARVSLHVPRSVVHAAVGEAARSRRCAGAAHVDCFCLIQSSITRCSSASGSEPWVSTWSWNSPSSNFAPSACLACSRSSRIFSMPAL